MDFVFSRLSASRQKCELGSQGMKSMSKNVFWFFPPSGLLCTDGVECRGVSAAASSPGSLEQAALLGPPATPLPVGQTPARWVEFLFAKKKNKIQNESDETSLSRLISKARPCKELRCASGTSGITRSGRQHGQGRPRSAASLPLPTGQRDGGKEIRFCCRCRAGILELRPERVPGTRWHPLGLARGGETGGV